ncbi:MAG: phosphoribosylglycinamide formyltransferase [Phycisphaeraceae bacterium]|nr:MAG: phosphoribosylglycinamide formyltransferase [Phycisphaeraceae bacterium]
MPQPVTPIAVMISGGGRTLLNLQDAIDRGELRAKITLVVASKEGVGAQRARDRGLPVVVEPGEIPADRLASILRGAGVAWVALAGYLKKVHIPPGFEGKVVNIHPALLPKFGGPGMYGRRVHEAVLRAGERESGCTVHLCDDRYDTGPIVLQESVPVVPGDTPDTLAARVFGAECRAYPEALRRLLGGER